MLVATGCSDDDEALQSQYGYVQFKLYKSTSFEKGTTTRAADKLESMSSAQKIKVVMTHNGTTVSQTLLLNAYNANNAEYGLRSDKLNYWPVLIRSSAIICMTVLMRYCWQDLPEKTMN